jgi:adenine-specific DNA-methyltransferase
MAIIDDLIKQIKDESLRKRIQAEADKLTQQKKFGLVFENHLPECTPLYEVPVKVGGTVSLKNGSIDELYIVKDIQGEQVLCVSKGDGQEKVFTLKDLVTTAEFGEPIYPYLQFVDSISNAPDSDLWHTLIEADNYHALQLLEYLYAGKVDCIYIDPPYNTGARDWKYNNDYVDSSDSYRHSKWLSMMEKRLKLAKKLLNPEDSVLICTIDEKEYLHLGCLLEELFPEAKLQMISSAINSKGTARDEFFRVNEYIFFVRFGNACPHPFPLNDEWEGNIKTSTTRKLRWGSLMRSGTGSSRSDSPGCFYPIFISEDKKRFCGVGDVVPLGTDRHTVKVPEGQIALFPIRKDGTEGRWQYSKDKFVELQSKGYARISTQTRNEASIRYISAGWQKKVENGKIKVKGKQEDGSLIFDDEDYVKEFIPNNQWWISAHNATEFGSKLLQNIIGKRFDFPKSLYAVRDAIRFFVADKPDALILDFFAGSGTTLHAVNLLNAEDGGQRRCILVTNNEVSDSEAINLTKQGYQPGDKEWEKLGIARYVTWPRTTCSIKGKDINGNPLKGDYGTYHDEYQEVEEELKISETDKPVRGKLYRLRKNVPDDEKMSEMKMADGFRSNAIYFKLGFLDKTAVALGRQFKELLSVLWMKAGSIGMCPQIKGETIPKMLILPEPVGAVKETTCGVCVLR